MERRELDLLVELARLLRKYGPEPFESLSASLASPEYSQTLARLLADVARVGRKAGTKARPSGAERRGEPTRKFLESIRPTHPEKYDVLSALHEDLADGTVLPSVRDMRQFAEELRLPELRATSRQRAIGQLIRSLSSLSAEEIRHRAQRLPRSRLGESGLKGWSDIILQGKRQTD
ncbi:MAG: hypothetical protein Q7R32_06040 [Dehalococcoidia bacterium]|nr:hypothetical protein [Dehalococcoidia bacterium]